MYRIGVMANPRGRSGQIILAYKIDSGSLSVFDWIASGDRGKSLAPIKAGNAEVWESWTML